MKKIILETKSEVETELTEREEKIYERGKEDGADDVLKAILNAFAICVCVIILAFCLFSIFKILNY